MGNYRLPYPIKPLVALHPLPDIPLEEAQEVTVEITIIAIARITNVRFILWYLKFRKNLMNAKGCSITR
jgi:hypothetical protein